MATTFLLSKAAASCILTITDTWEFLNYFVSFEAMAIFKGEKSKNSTKM
jgi:hypothetical protein